MSKTQKLYARYLNAKAACPGLPDGYVVYKRGHGYYISAGDRSLFLGKFEPAMNFLYQCWKTRRVNYAALRAR